MSILKKSLRADEQALLTERYNEEFARYMGSDESGFAAYAETV
jgi:hypothetical protein